MKFFKFILTVSVFLCFLGCIWSNHPFQWAATGIYAFFVSRYVIGTIQGKVIGQELQPMKLKLDITNLIKSI